MTRKLAYTLHLGDGVTLLKGTEDSDDTRAAFETAGVEPGAHVWEGYEPVEDDTNPAAVPIEPVRAQGAAAQIEHTPVEVDEPVQDIMQVVEPPRAGAGSSRDAWADYADRLGQPISGSDGRDDIIVKLQGAGLIS